LSVTLKFSSADIKSWLERETGSIFNPVHAKAQKLVEEMGKSVNSLAETSKMLLDNSAKEIEKRNMKTYGRARALNKLAKLWTDRIRQLRVPEKVTYESFSALVQDTQKAFTVTELDIRNYFPRISPFFILDRRKFQALFERAKLLWKEIDSFQTKEYVKTKTLEETFQLIDKLVTLEKQFKELEAHKRNVANDKQVIEREIAETQRKISELKTRGGVGQLSQTGGEIESLTVETKHNLQHLQKPFIKLQALATHGSGSGLTPEEFTKVGQYLDNPFEALSTEETGYPLLKQILEKLRRSIVEDKLKLKPEKARKAEQAINNIVNSDSLATLHKQSREARARKTQLSTSEEVAVTQRDLAKLCEHVDNLTRKKGVVETEEFTIDRNCLETAEKIRSAKSEIEKNVFSFMSKKITVV
jgi:phage shock protein A